MNKAELIDSIAQKSGLTKEQAGKALNGFVESVQEALQRNDSVVLVGFGTFSVKERAARTGRNPKTLEEIQIPASRAAGFKAGKALKDALN
ncbi:MULTISPECIES: HU family DNA-binding protein [Moraxella]|uniref:HU family DNA-binding protein n=1 Tax=Moraxella nasicaprae TaxID=2904122 RepID=A0ABY6F328_9GAMM|nr:MULTISPECIES: HU family DNA-binding protein [Moraxella]MDO4895117.1 HU family DNA-binding protein [Moraxella sp.]UXZ04493.1 HU family DNA-binding protein [Moraxella nasicaprae]